MCVGGHRRQEVSQGHYACDLLWPDAKLALEYDGEQSHVGLDRIAHDSERRNDLHHLDITVLSITKRQLGSTESFDRAARQIAKRLGTRLRLDECRYDWHARHTALRDKLLPCGMKLAI